MHVLERDERLKLDATCDLILSDALEALAGFNGTLDAEQWRALGQRDQLTTYRSVFATTGSRTPKLPTMGSNGGGTLRILATGHINSSLAHVTSGLYSDTSLDYHVQQCIFYAAPSSATTAEKKHGRNNHENNICPVIDATVLYAAECASRRTPFRFAGVKWCAWRTKDGERDLLAYERSGVTLDNEGQEITYHIIQSFDRPYAPEFKFPPGLRRMKLSVCFLYREVCEDLVECFALGEYSAKGSGISQRAEDAAVSDRILTVAKALSAYNAKRLSRLIEKNRHLPVLMSKSCLRCGTRRTVFDQLRNCGICKKSICRLCRKEKSIFQLNIDTKQPEREVFCAKCLLCANLPNTKPVSLETVKKNQERANRERSSSRSTGKREMGSQGSGSQGSHGSQASTASGSSPVSPAKLKALNTIPVKFNYDALFRNSAVKRVRRPRERASTMPTKIESGSSSNVDQRQRSVISERAPASSLLVMSEPEALTGIEVDLTDDVAVVAENLRSTQIGLPVILVDVKPLRETQLGEPVDIETGRLCEPDAATSPVITARSSCPELYSQNAVERLSSPPSSPSTRSSNLLYVDAHHAKVERLYHTYLGRREKMDTDENGERQRQNLRATIIHTQHHHQQQQQRENAAYTANRSTQVRSNSNEPRYGNQQVLNQSPSPFKDPTVEYSHDRSSRLSPLAEAAPKKQHTFHLDLYAQF
ncbi:hypothetical protein FI667_g10229, partial [Globisporangium splendens]